MKPMINLTLHEQGDAEVAVAACAGYNLDPVPRGVVVEEGQAGLEKAARTLATMLESAAENDVAVLIGGHTGAIVRAVLKAKSLPELFVFETERVRDANDRFVFKPKGLLRVSTL